MKASKAIFATVRLREAELRDAYDRLIGQVVDTLSSGPHWQVCNCDTLLLQFEVVQKWLRDDGFRAVTDATDDMDKSWEYVYIAWGPVAAWEIPLPVWPVEIPRSKPALPDC